LCKLGDVSAISSASAHTSMISSPLTHTALQLRLLIDPRYLPMLVRPLPWTNPHSGGLLAGDVSVGSGAAWVQANTRTCCGVSADGAPGGTVIHVWIQLLRRDQTATPGKAPWHLQVVRKEHPRHRALLVQAHSEGRLTRLYQALNILSSTAWWGRRSRELLPLVSCMNHVLLVRSLHSYLTALHHPQGHQPPCAGRHGATVASVTRGWGGRPTQQAAA
jgi:hypothetical protein